MFVWLVHKTSPVPLCVAVMSLLLGIPFFATTVAGYAPPDMRFLRNVTGTVVQKNTACGRFGCSNTRVDLETMEATYAIGLANCARARDDVQIGDRVTVRFIPYEDGSLDGQAYAVERMGTSWCGVGDVMSARARRYRVELYISGLIMLVGLLALSRAFFDRYVELKTTQAVGWSPRLPTASYLRGDDKYEVKL